jgi:hypothetical protein
MLHSQGRRRPSIKKPITSARFWMDTGTTANTASTSSGNRNGLPAGDLGKKIHRPIADPPNDLGPRMRENSNLVLPSGRTVQVEEGERSDATMPKRGTLLTGLPHQPEQSMVKDARRPCRSSFSLPPQALSHRGVVLVTADAVANTGDCHGQTHRYAADPSFYRRSTR